MLDNLQYEAGTVIENGNNTIKIIVLLAFSAILVVLSYYLAQKEKISLSIVSIATSAVSTCIALMFIGYPADTTAAEITHVFFILGTCIIRLIEGMLIHDESDNLIASGVIINLAYIIIFACIYI